MELEALTQGSSRWEELKEYARQCPWRAGPYLAREMDRGAFSGWERVIGLWEKGAPCGFCTVTKTDCLPDAPYTPYIGFVFVDEQKRGRRLSRKMIEFAMDYLKTQGFDRVYLVSDHENLYEKNGFTVVDTALMPGSGALEKIYYHAL